MPDEQLRKSQRDEATAEILGLAQTTRGGGSAPEPWVEQTTAIIKSFERPYFLSRLIASIRSQYPQLRILVCEDSRLPLFEDEAEPIPGVRWLTLPYEAGHTLGMGRNYLVDRTETPYLFLCDDDHEFVAQTRLPAMWKFLEQSGFDIVGGAQGNEEYGAANFVPKGSVMLQKFHEHYGLVTDDTVACDRVSNTFLARTDSLRRVRWEERVYGHEHADFFLRAKKANLRVAQMGRSYVKHDRSQEPAARLRDYLIGWISGHRDRDYRIQRLGGQPGESEKAVRRRARALYKKYVLDAHNISDIRDVTSRRRQRELEALIGGPGDPVPDERN